MTRRRQERTHPLRAGLLAGAAAFVLLSVFAGGLVEVSPQVGTLAWLAETAAYAFVNKLPQKLVASLVVAVFAGFASSMIAYGKAVRARRAKAAHLRFDAGSGPDLTKTA